MTSKVTIQEMNVPATEDLVQSLTSCYFVTNASNSGQSDYSLNTVDSLYALDKLFGNPPQISVNTSSGVETTISPYLYVSGALNLYFRNGGNACVLIDTGGG